MKSAVRLIDVPLQQIIPITLPRPAGPGDRGDVTISRTLVVDRVTNRDALQRPPGLKDLQLSKTLASTCFNSWH